MSTNKLFVWIAAALLSGVFCAFSAMADVAEPEAYKQLTAVEMAPGQMPMLHEGVGSLSGGENRHRERLPLQLEGAIKKVQKANYSPKVSKAKKKASKRSRF